MVLSRLCPASQKAVQPSAKTPRLALQTLLRKEAAGRVLVHRRARMAPLAATGPPHPIDHLPRRRRGVGSRPNIRRGIGRLPRGPTRQSRTLQVRHTCVSHTSTSKARKPCTSSGPRRLLGVATPLAKIPLRHAIRATCTRRRRARKLCGAATCVPPRHYCVLGVLSLLVPHARQLRRL